MNKCFQIPAKSNVKPDTTTLAQSSSSRKHGAISETDLEPTPQKKKTKSEQKEEEIDRIFYQLKHKHSSKYTDPQMKLWARMIANNLHTDLEDPPKVPMITGIPEASRKPQGEHGKESLKETVLVAEKAVAETF